MHATMGSSEVSIARARPGPTKLHIYKHMPKMQDEQPQMLDVGIEVLFCQDTIGGGIP